MARVSKRLHFSVTVCILALALTTVTTTANTVTDWIPSLKTASKQVVRLEAEDAEGEKGICTGVVLNADSGHILTAQHCVEGKPPIALTVQGRHAELVRANKLLDLAVVRGDLKDAASMPLAKEAPEMGTPVAILGYAWGAKALHAQFGHVSAVLKDDGWLMIDAVAIGGDSGGPTISAAGELVGMTRQVRYSMFGAAHLALMVPVEAIRDFSSQYLPAKK